MARKMMRANPGADPKRPAELRRAESRHEIEVPTMARVPFSMAATPNPNPSSTSAILKYSTHCTGTPSKFDASSTGSPALSSFAFVW
eukprot:jgi/Chrpa1/26411/Chrysochromulina_OHIO_Genome00008669-RA